MSSNTVRPHKSGGFTLIEAVVTMTVFAVGIIGVLGLMTIAKSTSERGSDLVQVSNYLQEGLEGVRTLRTAAWSNVSTDGTYHLVSQGSSNPPWQLVSGGTESIGKYSRTVTIAPVSRQDTDGSGTLTAGDKIVTSGGTLPDANTKKVTIDLSWQQGNVTRNRSLYYYLTNWQS